MELTPKTKLFPLLEQYPFLVDYLAGLRPQYRGLRNPALRKAFTRLASLAKVAQLGAMPVEELIAGIQQQIKVETGEEYAVELGDAPLTREERREVLKGIIKDLHAGQDVPGLKQRFADLIEDVGAAEIGEMEQELIKAGLPQSEITRLCDVHLDLFRDMLDDAPLPQLPAGHPVQTFLAENAALSEVAQALREQLAPLGDSPEDMLRERSELLAADLDKLMTVELHYQRKENQLFPVLEKHGISGPPQVMWEVHDQIRAHLKEAKRALQNDEGSQFVSALTEGLGKLEGMVEKEQLILLPMCLDRFSEDEWLDVWRGEEHLGFALVERGSEWPGADVGRQSAAPMPAEVRAAVGGRAGGSAFADVLLNLQTGVLTPEQVNLLFNNLPVEISFTDENHIVRYFSESGERIFPRSPGVIGRHVENCHPPKSVHMVKEILQAFESGERDTAEFWIEFGGRFVHIRYFAIHDGDGRFRGTLEVVQDVTEIRKLAGERRLLEWS